MIGDDGITERARFYASKTNPFVRLHPTETKIINTEPMKDVGITDAVPGHGSKSSSNTTQGKYCEVAERLEPAAVQTPGKTE